MADNKKIIQEDLALLATKAVSSVEGVGQLVRVPISFAMLADEKQNGIVINMNKEALVFDVFINVKYGVNIPQVAFAVQEKVKKAVDYYSNVKVNIHVQGIDF